MELTRTSKGQTFVIGAVVFSGLFLLATAPAGPSLSDSSGSDFRKFFQQSLDESINAFNEALSENRSINNVKRGLYRYNRFVLESSSNKGIDFGSYQLAVLPDKGEAVFINYQERNLDTNLFINGSWTNTTVDSKQSLQVDYTAGSTNVTLELPELDDRYSFTAHRPRVVYWMKMDSRDESWQNSVIG